MTPCQLSGFLYYIVNCSILFCWKIHTSLISGENSDHMEVMDCMNTTLQQSNYDEQATLRLIDHFILCTQAASTWTLKSLLRGKQATLDGNARRTNIKVYLQQICFRDVSLKSNFAKGWRTKWVLKWTDGAISFFCGSQPKKHMWPYGRPE